MARRTKVVKIEAENRDKGKQFLITEMPSTKGERWARRAVQAVLRANPEMGNFLSSDTPTPMVEIAKIGLKALGAMDDGTADDLFNEMMSCVQILLPDGKTTRPLIADSEIEEIKTLFELRKEVFLLHSGFFGLGE